MCGVAAGLSRPSKHLIRLAFTMRSSRTTLGTMSQDFRVWVLALGALSIAHLYRKFHIFDDGVAYPAHFCSLRPRNFADEMAEGGNRPAWRA